MKDESILDAAGPVFIITCVGIVLAVVTWVMVEYQGDWGSSAPEAVAAASSEAH